MLEELLSVPSVVKVNALTFFVLLGGVTNTSGVSSGDEVSDTASNSGGGVPQNFGRTTIEHGRGPDSQDNVVFVNSAIIDESLMLFHSRGERNIIILAPSTERVEKEDRVLVSSSDEVKSGLLEEEAMSIMEGVSDLEGKNSISVHLLCFGRDLSGSHSVLVNSIIPHNFLDEVHGFSRDKPFSLSHDSFNVRVRGLEASEGTGSDFFLSVLVEFRLVDDSDSFTLIGESDVFSTRKFILLCVSTVLGDRNRHEVNLSINSESLFVHAFEEFHLVHESFKGVSPSFSDSLNEFSLHLVDSKFRVVLGRSLEVETIIIYFDKRRNDGAGTVVVLDDAIDKHMALELLHALDKSVSASVDVETVFRSIVRSRNTSEVRDDTSTGFLVKSLSVTFLTDL